jgi:hypothetical protein
MARIRSVKPEFFQDEDLAVEVPNRDARLLYIGLWGLADEHGRLRGNASSIKGELFAYDMDLTPEVIDKLIDMLVDTGRAVRYTVRSSVYLFLPKLAKNQRLEPSKVPSRLPAPPSELAEQNGASSSENFPHESAPHADKLSLKQAASSREQVASQRGAHESALPPGADQAARLILDASGVTPEIAVEAAVLIARERKHRNLPGLVQRIIDAGELSDWLRKAEAALRKQAAARASPVCVHGRRNCPTCRSEQLGGVA